MTDALRPRSSVGGLRRRAHVLLALTRSDLRIRYGRGAWQLVNWIVNPFALVGVYLLLRIMLDRGGNAAALSLSCAVVPFQLVILGCESAMGAVALREPVLLNRQFDRMLLPASAVLTEAFAFAASFLLFPLTMLLGGVAPTVHVLWLPVVVVVTLVFSQGLAWPAALFGLWFPTLKLLASQGLRILFFAAPGVVALAEVSGSTRDWIVLNPLTGIFESYRDALLYGEAPSLAHLAYPTAVGIALTVVTLPLYRREQRHFAKLVRS